MGTVTTLTGHTPQTGDSYARIGAPAGASIAADVAAVKSDTGTLVSRITATLFSGITSLGNWLRAIARKGNVNATAESEINADVGDGAGTYSGATDATEAIRDRGDAAWGGGGGGGTDWTSDELNQIRFALGVDGTKVAATGGQLQDMKAKTDLITAAGITVSNGTHITPSGDGYKLTLTQGEAYLDALNNAVEQTFIDARLPSDVDSNGTIFTLRLRNNVRGGEKFAYAGTVESWDSGTSTLTLRWDVPQSDTVNFTRGADAMRFEIDAAIAGVATDVLTLIVDSPVDVNPHIA